MRQIHLFSLLLIVFAATSLTARGGRKHDGTARPAAVTAEQFMRYTSGKGWQHVESHEVKANGDIDKRDYRKSHAGAKPELYAFSGDTVTTYVCGGAYPINGYRARRYAYNCRDNSLTADGTEVFRVLSVSDTELKIVKYEAMRGDGKKIYVCSTYRPMTRQELDSCRAKHRYDLDTFNELYPALPEQERLTAADFARYAVGFGWKCAEAHKMETPGRYDIADYFGGGGPGEADNYFIAADTLTRYTPAKGGQQGAKESMRYAYRANGFYVATGPSTGFHVLSVNDQEMRIVKQMPSADGSQPVSLYCVYRKMTDDELRQAAQDAS